MKGRLGDLALITLVVLSILFLARAGSPDVSAAPRASSPARSGAATASDPQQYPIMDAIANKIIQKYQNSTCEQLWEEKAQAKNKPKTAQEQQAITILRNDPQMRAAFIGRVAPPIANKMFDCGMIP